MTNTRRPICIVGAMDAEICEFLKHSNITHEEDWNEFVFRKGKLCDKEVVIVKSGVGKVFAAMVAEKIIDEFNPKAVVFTGVGGGLNPTLEIGDVVVSSDCIQHDLDAEALGFPRGQIPYTEHRVFVSDRNLLRTALQTKLRGHKIFAGRILTGDQFITKKEMKDHKYLMDELKGDVVEMEGGAIAQVCTITKTPFLIVRTISDKANGEAVEDFNAFSNVVAKNSFEVTQTILKGIDS